MPEIQACDQCPVRAIHLTTREVETLIQIARGQSNDEIAASMGITHNTVRTYLTRIHAKLVVHSHRVLTAWATSHIDLLYALRDAGDGGTLPSWDSLDCPRVRDASRTCPRVSGAITTGNAAGGRRCSPTLSFGECYA